jgi:hypothetical protein
VGVTPGEADTRAAAEATPAVEAAILAAEVEEAAILAEEVASIPTTREEALPMAAGGKAATMAPCANPRT